MFEINMCFNALRQKTGANEKNTARPCKMPKGGNNGVIESVN